jgi:hypothetical protein
LEQKKKPKNKNFKLGHETNFFPELRTSPRNVYEIQSKIRAYTYPNFLFSQVDWWAVSVFLPTEIEWWILKGIWQTKVHGKWAREGGTQCRITHRFDFKENVPTRKQLMPDPRPVSFLLGSWVFLCAWLDRALLLHNDVIFSEKKNNKIK